MAVMGRPKKIIKEAELRGILRLKPTIKDVAAFFECHVTTIETHIRNNHDMTFSAFREENMVHTRFNLIRNALQMAEAKNVPMMIFCLKNLCKWRDRWDEPESEEDEKYEEPL